ncbi:uncharacterized protein GGS22DRAFT_188616 [Annulohypoxylon maeteangense]|uniref:uncharacterized protein n=1 Tax=Annulohypoxylon maeteangense TaxID=1927788 RepID=UPI002007EF7A|nr:uncharacterized protein GGS22DRAFT_188616 [Annulohypoxylon maeteangense]KAI0885325.1 hypothetical protein GGS22DRAFT_188616 [Annulohypoxylon maeteangense]
MADYAELELKTFELSSSDSNASLSVTSLALISGPPISQHHSEELYQLIRSKQLWLISPGVCRIQISMVSNESDVGFLEHLADAICQCSVWAALGLTIKQEDIQYQPLYDGAPNLYFIVEHPQKSSILISPPHCPTAQFNGIECLFRYQSEENTVSHATTEQYDICDTDMGDYSHETTLQLEDSSPIHTPYRDEMSGNYWSGLIVDTHINRTQQRWDDAAYFAQMALHVTIGVKKRMHGLRLFQLDDRPSLLELAPAIWNARYLEAVTSHVANFPIISNILATSSRGQSPSLRQKSARLLLDNIHPEKVQDGEEPDGGLNIYRSSIQQRLWGLLQTTLKPTTRIKNGDLSVNSWKGGTTNEDFEFMSMETDGLDEFEIGLVDDTDGDNLGFDEFFDGGGQLHKFMACHQIEDPDSDSGMVTEHQQRWQRREVLHLEAFHAGEEAQSEEPGHQSDPSLSDSFRSQPQSSHRELLDISTDNQYYPHDFTESIINIDDLCSSNDLRTVETVYGDSYELPYNSENISRDDGYYTTWSDKAIIDGNNYLDEEMDYQAPQMYEY